MKNNKLILGFLVFALGVLMVACGGSESSTANTSLPPENTDISNSNFEQPYSGDEEIRGTFVIEDFEAYAQAFGHSTGGNASFNGADPFDTSFQNFMGDAVRDAFTVYGTAQLSQLFCQGVDWFVGFGGSNNVSADCNAQTTLDFDWDGNAGSGVNANFDNFQSNLEAIIELEKDNTDRVEIVDLRINAQQDFQSIDREEFSNQNSQSKNEFYNRNRTMVLVNTGQGRIDLYINDNNRGRLVGYFRR